MNNTSISSNLTINTTDTRPWTTSQALILMSVTSVYTVLLVGGVFGNSAIAYIILTQKRMHSATNWLVFNLAIADNLVAIITVPFTILLYDQRIDWPFGMIACKYLLMPVMEHFAGACVLTHTAVGLARFSIVKKNRDISNKFVTIIIFLIWFLAFFSMSAVYMGILGQFEMEDNKCQLIWKAFGTIQVPFGNKTWEVKGNHIFSAYVFPLTYVFPIILTGYSYHKINVISSGSLRRISHHLAQHQFQMRQRRNRRMNKILTNMYVLFAVTTLPYQIFLIAHNFTTLPSETYVSALFYFFLGLFYTQITTTPLVLFYMGEDYRRRLYELPICCCVDVRNMRKMSLFVRQSMRDVSDLSRRISEGGKKISISMRKISTSVWYSDGRKISTARKFSDGRKISNVRRFSDGRKMSTARRISDGRKISNTGQFMVGRKISTSIDSNIENRKMSSMRKYSDGRRISPLSKTGRKISFMDEINEIDENTTGASHIIHKTEYLMTEADKINIKEGYATLNRYIKPALKKTTPWMDHKHSVPWMNRKSSTDAAMFDQMDKMNSIEEEFGYNDHSRDYNFTIPDIPEEEEEEFEDEDEIEEGVEVGEVDEVSEVGEVGELETWEERIAGEEENITPGSSEESLIDEMSEFQRLIKKRKLTLPDNLDSITSDELSRINTIFNSTMSRNGRRMTSPEVHSEYNLKKKRFSISSNRNALKLATGDSYNILDKLNKKWTSNTNVGPERSILKIFKRKRKKGLTMDKFDLQDIETEDEEIEEDRNESETSASLSTTGNDIVPNDQFLSEQIKNEPVEKQRTNNVHTSDSLPLQHRFHAIDEIRDGFENEDIENEKEERTVGKDRRRTTSQDKQTDNYIVLDDRKERTIKSNTKVYFEIPNKDKSNVVTTKNQLTDSDVINRENKAFLSPIDTSRKNSTSLKKLSLLLSKRHSIKEEESTEIYCGEPMENNTLILLNSVADLLLQNNIGKSEALTESKYYPRKENNNDTSAVDNYLTPVSSSGSFQASYHVSQLSKEEKTTDEFSNLSNVCTCPDSYASKPSKLLFTKSEVIDNIASLKKEKSKDETNFSPLFSQNLKKKDKRRSIDRLISKKIIDNFDNLPSLQINEKTIDGDCMNKINFDDNEFQNSVSSFVLYNKSNRKGILETGEENDDISKIDDIRSNTKQIGADNAYISRNNYIGTDVKETSSDSAEISKMNNSTPNDIRIGGEYADVSKIVHIRYDVIETDDEDDDVIKSDDGHDSDYVSYESGRMTPNLDTGVNPPFDTCDMMTVHSSLLTNTNCSLGDNPSVDVLGPGTLHGQFISTVYNNDYLDEVDFNLKETNI